MDKLESEVSALRKMFQEALRLLDITTPQILDSTVPRIVYLTNEIKSEHRKLKQNYASCEIASYDDEFQILAKQISEKFDNTIRKVKIAVNDLKSELLSLQNKKLLNQYNR